MGPPHEGSIRRPIAPRANALTTELHLALNLKESKIYTKYCLKLALPRAKNIRASALSLKRDKNETKSHEFKYNFTKVTCIQIKYGSIDKKCKRNKVMQGSLDEYRQNIINTFTIL